MSRTSDIGDLTDLAKEIHAVIEKHTGAKAAFAVAFTLEPEWDEAHYVTNVSRSDGIAILVETAVKMDAQRN